MKKILLLLALLLPAAAPSYASVLGDNANAMVAGEWRRIAAVNTNVFLGGPTSGYISGFANDMVWDPIAKKVYFIGSDHGATVEHVTYDEATNTWSNEAAPPFSQAIPPSHGYDSNVFDIQGRRFYYKEYGNFAVHKWNPATATWEANLPSGAGAYGDCAIACYASAAMGVEWFPERLSNGSLLLFQVENGTDGVLIEYNPATNTWARLQLAGPLLGVGDPHNFMLYNPVHKLVWFGGGNGSLKNWVMNDRGTITAKADAPASFGNIGINSTLQTYDPVTGDFLVFKSNTNWYAFSPRANIWTAQVPNATIFDDPVSQPANRPFGTVAVPIPQYGVILFVKAVSPSLAETWLYKHAASTTADRDFWTRCFAQGVVKCVGFDSTADTEGNTQAGVVRIDPGSAGTPPILDDGTRASGLRSLRMTVGAGQQGSAGGSWDDNFRDDMTRQVDAAGEFYVQWRQRFSAGYVFLSGPGFKQIIIGQGDNAGDSAFSCTDQEIVLQNTNGRGFPQMYHSCGAKNAIFEPLEEPIPATSDFFMQNAIRGPTGVGCRFQAQGPCVDYVLGEWLTFKIRIKVSSPWYTNNGVYVHNGIIQMWMAREGQASVLLQDYRQVGDTVCDNTQQSIPACQTGYDNFRAVGDTTSKYGKVWLLPYSGTDAYPNSVNTWYDELIVSTQNIADPGGTTPPAKPTGFKRVP